MFMGATLTAHSPALLPLQVTSSGATLSYTISYEVNGSPSRPSGPDVIMAVSTVMTSSELDTTRINTSET